jgi:6,7-dimethyl-8-ribityllumazine synthase
MVQATTRLVVARADGARILIVAARYYADVVDALIVGASRAVADAGAESEVIEIPGAFEAPAAIAIASQSGLYDGYIALGCVIRGETSHYDYVCGESARGLMDLSIQDGLAIGYGILTVENEAQAIARADPAKRDKGGEAARACLAMLALRRRFEDDPQ